MISSSVSSYMIPSSPSPTMIRLISQRLQIEHRDGRVAAVGRKAVAGLGGDAGAVHAHGVRNVAEYFTGGAFDHHHVVGARNEHATGGGFDGDIIGASVPFNIEFFNLERLRVPEIGRGKAD